MNENKFIQYQPNKNMEEVNVCGISFSVQKDDKGIVQRIQKERIEFSASCDTIFFLGMATALDRASEWWGQNEVLYDYSCRVFIGDRLMRIQVHYEDQTEELISVIFGVNAWNYGLYCKPQTFEISALDFYEEGCQYPEPFLSDPEARAIKDRSLKLMENTSPDVQKNTKWVFGYKLNSNKKIKYITFTKEPGKQANIAISAVTGLLPGESADPSWVTVGQKFFLRKDYYADMDKLARRLYQFRDELPQQDPKVEISDFQAPDITFTGAPMAEVYTNVYRMNIDDMAKNKVTEDGMPHTSSQNTADFGYYIGFGTFSTGDHTYSTHVWTRDIGRTLMELVNLGCDDRLLLAADQLHEMLYYHSKRFQLPHWKRIANMLDFDFNEGNENDGHASIMLFMYSLYRKGIVGIDWLKEHEQQLRDAADYYVWQKNNPTESNFNEILYSMSEASTQADGGYDLFSNLISAYALTGYSRMFEVLGDTNYAKTLSDLSAELRSGVMDYFAMEHPRYGTVYTDTIDDCWTYEYKRMVDLLIFSDLYGYDMSAEAPELFDLMTRTFLAQKESYYAPESGRQMGYGQGYLTQAAIMLDMTEEMTDCMNAAAMFCYHHTDFNYIVPEGVILHGAKQFWFRNSNLGNAVQQAEIVKCARLLVGIDDIQPERGLRLIPRLPKNWNRLQAENYPVTVESGERIPFSFCYERGAGNGKITACAGDQFYTANWSGNTEVEYIRMGPFETADITVTAGTIKDIKKIQNNYYAYITANGV